MNQMRLSQYGVDSEVDLTLLSRAERAAYVADRINGTGVREHALTTDAHQAWSVISFARLKRNSESAGNATRRAGAPRVQC